MYRIAKSGTIVPATSRLGGTRFRTVEKAPRNLRLCHEKTTQGTYNVVKSKMHGMGTAWCQSLILGAFGHVGGVRVVWLLTDIIIVFGFQ